MSCILQVPHWHLCCEDYLHHLCRNILCSCAINVTLDIHVISFADFKPTVSNLPPTSTSKKKTSLIVAIVVSVAVVSIISIFAIYFLRRQKRLSGNGDEGNIDIKKQLLHMTI